MEPNDIKPGMSILGEEHFHELKRGLEITREGLRQVKLARQAGMDFSIDEKTLKDNEAQILRLLQVYFPGRSV